MKIHGGFSTQKVIEDNRQERAHTGLKCQIYFIIS